MDSVYTDSTLHCVFIHHHQCAMHCARGKRLEKKRRIYQKYYIEYKLYWAYWISIYTFVAFVWLQIIFRLLVRLSLSLLFVLVCIVNRWFLDTINTMKMVQCFNCDTIFVRSVVYRWQIFSIAFSFHVVLFAHSGCLSKCAKTRWNEQCDNVQVQIVAPVYVPMFYKTFRDRILNGRCATVVRKKRVHLFIRPKRSKKKHEIASFNARTNERIKQNE